MPDQSSAATEHAILAEITRPLETLPDDPLALVDADFPMALRGYERGAVDDYVRQTRQLLAELQATRSPEAAVRRALERVGEQISGILQRAHETAEQITAQSRSEAEDRLEQARLEATQIADAAEQRVKDLDADTDRIWLERQRIVGDAEDLSGQLLALAKNAAERFPADAEVDAEAQAAGTVASDDETVVDERSEVERTLAFSPLDASEVTWTEGGAPEGTEPESAEPESAEPESTEPEGGEPGSAEAHEAEPAATESEAEATQQAADAPGTDDDATAVIPPPASEAANRRRNH
jgi:cell division septum initiation protein DivIVA